MDGLLTFEARLVMMPDHGPEDDIIAGSCRMKRSNRVARLQFFVRTSEADILALSGARGNLATPFAWGSYLSWRLYPNIKISMDGRYETTYPESTFALNNDFFDHQGDWFRLCRDYKVDYVILDLQTEQLRPEDLIAKGYVLIWKQENVSALLASPNHAQPLLQTAKTLPPTTIDPLDLPPRAKRGADKRAVFQQRS